VCAVVPEESARFRHDPAVGLMMDAEASEDTVRTLGLLSAWKQLEDLRALKRFSGAGVSVAEAAPVGSNGSAPESEPADRLAAWLLKQADVPAEG